MDYEKLFLEYYEDCVKWLEWQVKCDRDTADSCYVESFLIFRQRVKLNKFVEDNVKGYLKVVMKRYWIRHFGKLPVFNSKIPENNFILDLEYDDKRLEVFRKAWEKLSNGCQEILQDRYLSFMSSKDMMEEYNLKSEAVVNDKVRVCKNRLRDLFNEFHNK